VLGPYKENQKTPLPGGIARWIFDFIHSDFSKNITFSIVDMSIIGDRSKNRPFFSKLYDEYKRAIYIKQQTDLNLKTKSFDYAHLHTACGKYGIIRDYLTLRKIHKKNIKIISHFHCNVHLHANKSKVTLFYFKKILNISDVVIALNEKSKNFICATNPKTTVIKIPNFISESEIRKDEKKINDPLKNIIYVGFVRKAKGFEEIIQVAKSFPDKKFTLIGQVDPSYIGMSYPSNINLINYASRDVIFKYLDESDMFLFPSHSEGFSIALLEAMARGLPIVCSDVGANAEMVENKVGGYVIEPKNSDLLISAIKLIEDSVFRSNSSMKNLSKVKSCYIDSIVIKKIISIYETD